jgi:hypothetical protein
MIWALLAMYFLSGTGVVSGAVLTADEVATLRDQVSIVIEDADRQKAVSATLKALHEEARAFEKSFAKSGKKLSKLYAEHADNRELMSTVLDGLNAEWSGRQTRATDALFKLRGQLTEQEWTDLFESD